MRNAIFKAIGDNNQFVTDSLVGGGGEGFTVLSPTIIGDRNQRIYIGVFQALLSKQPKPPVPTGVAPFHLELARRLMACQRTFQITFAASDGILREGGVRPMLPPAGPEEWDNLYRIIASPFSLWFGVYNNRNPGPYFKSGKTSVPGATMSAICNLVSCGYPLEVKIMVIAALLAGLRLADKPDFGDDKAGEAFKHFAKDVENSSAPPKKAPSKDIKGTAWGQKPLDDAKRGMSKGDLEHFLRNKFPQNFGEGRGDYDDGALTWGKMHILDGGRSLYAVGRHFGSRRRSADSGVIPKQMSRWCADKAIFAPNRVNDKGYASILVDCSGSMSINYDQLNEFIKLAPHGIMACYNGNGSEGVLDIVAKEGRYKPSLAKMGHGNIVDGPALRWLAAQKGPRIWVSDTEVTGCEDDTAAHLVLEAKTICYAADIEILPNLTVALETVKNSRRNLKW